MNSDYSDNMWQDLLINYESAFAFSYYNVKTLSKIEIPNVFLILIKQPRTVICDIFYHR